MARSRNLPDFDRLSVLVATVLLAYATARFVELPPRVLSLQFGAVYLPLRFSVNTAVALIVAGMMATGADWLLHGHPRLPSGTTLPHWLLPALTAWVLSVPLASLPLSPLWWLAFALGGLLLATVLIAEYVVVDPDDARRFPAAAGLIALSYALFLILVVALRSVGFRLLLQLPAVALTAGFVSLRAVHLRLPDRWRLPQALAVALVAAQFTAALHYLPVNPIAFGLALLAPVYALSVLVVNLGQGNAFRQAAIEPLVIFAGLWAIALLLNT